MEEDEALEADLERIQAELDLHHSLQGGSVHGSLEEHGDGMGPGLVRARSGTI